MKQQTSPLLYKKSFSCLYCGSETGVLTESSFCCVACEGLYRLKNETHLEPRSASFEKSLLKYSYLDQPSFQTKYLTPHQEMLFYVEGLHCSSCVHLLEQLPAFDKEVLSARVNFADSTLLVSLTDDPIQPASWARVAATIEELGYRPAPLSPSEDPKVQYQKENRDFLKRLGVAGACAGNMMLFVIPVYGGLSGFWGQVFNFVSFLLFLPILFYSAKPFYQGAWNFLKYRTINVDLPIVVAFLSGFSLSTYNLLRGEGPVYYDSTASFLFLILGSRYLLKRAQQKYLGTVYHQQMISPAVNTGDTVQVLQGQTIPVDGVLLSPTAEIDLALFSGESLPQLFQQGMKVFAGTTLLSAEASIRVEAKDADTRLGHLMAYLRTEAVKKTAFVSLTDKLAQGLIVTVFAIALLYFALNASSDLQESLQRSLALIVIACPCALAFGTPLAYGLAIKKARGLGIIIKNGDVFEKVLKIKNIFVDKTGTLTEGTLHLVGIEGLEPQQDSKKIILALESISYHPIAFALRKAWGSEVRELPRLEKHQEILGRGVEGWLDGHHFTLSTSQQVSSGRLSVELRKDGHLLTRLFMSDQIRGDSSTVLRTLSRDYNIQILSGDRNSQIPAIATACGISLDRCHGELSPEQKLALVQSKKFSCMIGDGANDALALQAADVGIAVKGSVDLSLSSADIYFTRGGLSPFLDLLKLARQTRFTLYRNLVISFTYNTLGGIFALAGFINPMVAAILMPISSALIVLSSMRGTR